MVLSISIETGELLYFFTMSDISLLSLYHGMWLIDYLFWLATGTTAP